MPNYDTGFSPPAPVALTELRHPETGAVFGNVPMLLDTGADVTLLPRGLITQFGIPLDPAQVYELVGFDGTRSTAIGVELDLIFVGVIFRGRYLVTNQSDGILGRDILNWLNVAFNGPNLEWDKIG